MLFNGIDLFESRMKLRTAIKIRNIDVAESIIFLIPKVAFYLNTKNILFAQNKDILSGKIARNV
jgi:hypothetical protein